MSAGSTSSSTPAVTSFRTPPTVMLQGRTSTFTATSVTSTSGATSISSTTGTAKNITRRAPIAFTSPEQRLAAMVEHIRTHNFGTPVEEILSDAGLTEDEFV